MLKQKKPFPLPRLDHLLDFTDPKQGFVAVLVGIIAALVVGGLAAGYNWTGIWIYWILGIGVIVGILNVFHKEGVLFVLSGLTLTLMLNLLASLALFPVWAVTLFNAVVLLLAPILIIISIKVLYASAVR